MDHVLLLRYVIEGRDTPEWEQRVRDGEWLSRARLAGVTPTTFQRFDLGREALVDTVQGYVWRAVEAYLTEYHAAPTFEALDRTVCSQYDHGRLSQDEAQTLRNLLGEVSAARPQPEGFDYALEETLAQAGRAVVSHAIFQATKVLQDDPGAALDLLRDVEWKAGGADIVSVKEAAETRWDLYQQRSHSGPDSIPTGFWQVDDRTGGLWPGDFALVAARSSVGKSFTLCAMALRQMQLGWFPLVVAAEMHRDQYLARLEGLASGIDPKWIRLGCIPTADLPRYQAALEELRNPQYGDIDIVDYTQAYRVNQLADLVRMVEDKHQRKVTMVMVDPLYRLRPNRERRGGQEWETIRDISVDVKSLAGHLGIPFFATHQLNKTEGRNPNVGIEGLREGDAIGYELDTLWIAVQKDDVIEYRVKKDRSGEAEWTFLLRVDLSRGLIAEPEQAGSGGPLAQRSRRFGAKQIAKRASSTPAVEATWAAW